MWSRDFAVCRQCGTTNNKHMAKGLCTVCYQAAYRTANAPRIAQTKDEWYHRFHGDNLLKRAAYRRDSQYSGLWETIIERDGRKCTRCNSTLNLVVHHKDRTGRGKTEHNNDPENLETLCRKCHLDEHRPEHPQKRPRQPSGRWSRHHDHCQDCATTAIKHRAFGLCRTCYERMKRKTDLE
jgi:hypothetical protein